VSIVALSDAEVAFARHLAGHVHWARDNDDKFPLPEWSLKECLAVALVLDKRDYLATRYPQNYYLAGNSVSYALDQVCRGMVLSCDDRIAWLHCIRDAIEGFTKELPPESDQGRWPA